MNKQVLNLDELSPVICEVIASGGEFRLFPRGVSMLPLLRQGTDSVVLVSPDNVSVNDIVLYRRDDGQFVLHRIVGTRDDEYIMCGDNQLELEYGIKKKHLVARVAYFYRDEQRVGLDNKDYLKYVKALPKRRRKRKLRVRLARIKNAIFKRKKTK